MIQQLESWVQGLSKNWWLFVLRGVLAIIFGIIVVAWPSVSVSLLVIFFGAYVFVDGIFLLVHSFTYKGGWGHRALLIFSGIAGIAAGIITFVWPDITALALLIIIAVWAFVIGFAEIFFAFAAPVGIGNRLLLALGGVFSIIFGIFLVARPGLGVLGVIWIISIYAIMAGIYIIVFGITLKNLKTKT